MTKLSGKDVAEFFNDPDNNYEDFAAVCRNLTQQGMVTLEATVLGVWLVHDIDGRKRLRRMAEKWSASEDMPDELAGAIEVTPTTTPQEVVDAIYQSACEKFGQPRNPEQARAELLPIATEILAKLREGKEPKSIDEQVEDFARFLDGLRPEDIPQS